MRALEPYVRPAMVGSAAGLWSFQALVSAVVEGRPLISATMVLLLGVFFWTVGWDILLPMRDDSSRVTPPGRAATVAAAKPPVQNVDEDVPSPNRSRRPAREEVLTQLLQRWPCAPTVH